jgi:hypothetical protein
MNRFTVPRLLVTGAVLVALIVGCSGGGNPSFPTDQNHSLAGPTLKLGDITQTGDEITVAVEYTGAKNVRAMSFRVGFDSAGLRPLDVDWSPSVGGNDSCFQMLDRAGFLPLAMASMGNPDGLTGDGILCNLRFMVLDRGHRMPWIIDDRRFLVAKDIMGRPLNLCVGGGAR